jgi:hypothetical protein
MHHAFACVLLLLAPTAAKISTMHFACNASGPENAMQLQADLLYSSVIFEFRHEMLVKPWTHAELVLERQADSLAKLAAVQHRPVPDIFVYRNTNAGSMFANQARVMFDPAFNDLFLRPATVDPTLNISWRAFDFRQPNASKFYLDAVVAEAVNESVRAVDFFYLELG